MQLVLHRRRQRGVGLEGRSDITMPNPSGHCLDVGAASNQRRDMTLPHTVRCEALYLSVADEPVKGPPDVGGIYRAAGRGRKDQIVVSPVQRRVVALLALLMLPE